MQACLGAEYEIIALGHDRLELGNPSTTDLIVETKADLVIHGAAYTNVDGCARDPELAYRINALGTQYVAHACRRLDAPLVYISTNEVFAGDANQPYFEYDPTRAINAYGRSKLAGEQAVRDLLDNYYIVRVSWLFGGERNFVRTVLRLAANPPEGGVRMVNDEIGSPTYAPDVAEGVRQLIGTLRYGIYHFVNSGYCSRFAFAQAIASQGGFDPNIFQPISLSDYRRDSTPPPFAPLANLAGTNLGINFRPWEAAVAEYLTTLS